MEGVILIDTNFIITCVRQKIDLFTDLKEMFGIYQVLIPKQVISELEIIIAKKGVRLKDKEAAELSKIIFNMNKKNNKLIDLNEREVDIGILKYSISHKEIIIATLDRDLKDRILRKNPSASFLTIKNMKKIALQ